MAAEFEVGQIFTLAKPSVYEIMVLREKTVTLRKAEGDYHIHVVPISSLKDGTYIPYEPFPFKKGDTLIDCRDDMKLKITNILSEEVLFELVDHPNSLKLGMRRERLMKYVKRGKIKRLSLLPDGTCAEDDFPYNIGEEFYCRDVATGWRLKEINEENLALECLAENIAWWRPTKEEFLDGIKKKNIVKIL